MSTGSSRYSTTTTGWFHAQTKLATTRVLLTPFSRTRICLTCLETELVLVLLYPPNVVTDVISLCQEYLGFPLVQRFAIRHPPLQPWFLPPLWNVRSANPASAPVRIKIHLRHYVSLLITRNGGPKRTHSPTSWTIKLFWSCQSPSAQEHCRHDPVFPTPANTQFQWHSTRQERHSRVCVWQSAASCLSATWTPAAAAVRFRRV